MLISSAAGDVAVHAITTPVADQAHCLRLAVQAQQESDGRGGEIRRELVRRIRQRIAAGHYLTSDKIDHCVDRLLAEFLSEGSASARPMALQRVRA